MASTDDGPSETDSTETDSPEIDPTEPDPTEIDPTDIDPAGATIAVAFTGAVIALVGFGLSTLVGPAALPLAAIGLVVILASPVAYLRVRTLRGG